MRFHLPPIRYSPFKCPPARVHGGFQVTNSSGSRSCRATSFRNLPGERGVVYHDNPIHIMKVACPVRWLANVTCGPQSLVSSVSRDFAARSRRPLSIAKLNPVKKLDNFLKLRSGNTRRLKPRGESYDAFDAAAAIEAGLAQGSLRKSMN